MNFLGVELKRSSAFGVALFASTVGVTALYVAPGRWSGGWMPLALSTREYTVFLWPLALAAGARQGRRDHQARVVELFATTPRPRARRSVPLLLAMAGAVALAYGLVLAAGAVRLLSPARFLPPGFVVVAAAGALSLIAAAWLGLGLGRLLPVLVTAPVLAIAGVLFVGFTAVAPPMWLGAVLSPMHGTLQSYPYQTIDGRVTAAFSIWMTALALTGAWLFVADGRWHRAAAALPALIGLGVALAVKLWRGLRKLPEDEALARVAAVRDAVIACRDSSTLLTRSTR